MKKLLLVLSVPLSVVFGFIPYIYSYMSNPDSLVLFPKIHNFSYPVQSCNLNVFQPRIRLVIGNDDNDSLVRTAATVCTTEIHKAFYFTIDTTRFKNDSTRPIKEVTIMRQDTLPVDNQAVQIIFAFGKKGDLLVNNVLSKLGLTQNDIPSGDTTEGYLLTGKSQTTNPKRLLVLCAGNTNLGCFRGASTLRELIAQHSQGLLPAYFKIRDWPDCPWREVSWADIEVGGAILPRPDTAKLSQLDYFSLLKCAQVDHAHHKYYFQPSDQIGLKTPIGWSDNQKDSAMQAQYTTRISTNNIPFWYHQYRHRGIEPIPVLFNYQPIYHIGVWNPNTYAGTFDSLKFVVGSDSVARPVYQVPQMYSPNNPCFDDTSRHNFPNPTRDTVYSWWFNTASTGFAHWDKNIKYAGAASMKLVCAPGQWITMMSKKIPLSNPCLFSYWAKTSPNFLAQEASAKLYVRAHFKNTNSWDYIESALGPLNKTKWNGIIDDTLPVWHDFSLGICPIECDTVVFYINFSVPLTAPDTAKADSCWLWVDGDPCMNNPGSLTARYTQQQRFLIQTPTGKERVWRNSQQLGDSLYSIEYGGLSYDYSNGCLNTADTGHPNENFCLKLKIDSPGDTVSMAYNHITGGFFFADFKPSSRCNYASPTVDSITALYDSTGVELVRNNLHTPFIDHNYNEVAQNSLDRDGRVKIKGWTKPRVLAEDIHYNLRHTQKDDAYNNKKPTMTMLADALLPQHQGKETWTAIDTIKSMYPLDVPYIIPKTWGFTFNKDSILTYKKHRDSLTAEVETLADRGFALVLNPFRGKYLWWLSTLAYLKDSTNIEPKGFAWTSDTAPAWTSRDFRGDTVNFEYLPLSMDLAWNLSSSRFKWSGGEPESVRVTYNPDTLHLHKGDIFSPPVVNFKGRWRLVPEGNAFRLTVHLSWSANINRDRDSTLCYHLERWNWAQRRWSSFRDKSALDTTCVDSTPSWGSVFQGIKRKYLYARYRICAFDSLRNRSYYNEAVVPAPFIGVAGPNNPNNFSMMTAYLCQNKVYEPTGMSYLVYTGGMNDTFALCLKFSLLDSIHSPAETLGIGKFPALVAKQGSETDTLGVAYLSKHDDTIYYRWGRDTVWNGPSVLYAGTPASLSVPRIALGPGDTVHLTFVKRNIRGDTLTLNYGKFSLTNPTVTIQPLSSWSSVNPSGPIDSLGAAIAIDYNGIPHLAWPENNLVKYGIKLGGGFVSKVLSSTAATKTACITAPPPQDAYNVGVGWSEGNAIVRSYFYIENTAEIFRDTVSTGDSLRNVTGRGSFITFEENNNVFTSLWDPVNRTWSLPETLSYDTLTASYPQLDAWQTIDSTDNLYPARFVIWTQMRPDSLFEIVGDVKRYENGGDYGITPYAYLKMGKATPTPLTVHRDGFYSFGSEDYKQIDFGRDSLVYLLLSLEPDGKYRIFTEFYFDTTAPNGWMAALTVNGITIRDSITITPRQLLRFNDFLPANIGAMGYLRIKLTNRQGGYVSCSRIIITRFKEE